MSSRGVALEAHTSVESGMQSASNFGVNLAERHFQQSDSSQSNTAAQHLKPLEIVDELAKMPVCEEAVCVADTRHVDVYSPANFAEDQFKLLDKDGNGYIRDDEIKAYQERFRETMTPRMKQNLDSLLTNYQSTMQLANDEWGYENDGITRDDLDALEDRENGVRLSEHIKEFAAKHFDATDTDKNGFVTVDEIKAYEKNHGDKLEHPVSDREVLNVIGTLSQSNYAIEGHGDNPALANPRGMSKVRVLQAAELAKGGVERYTDPFFFFDKK